MNNNPFIILSFPRFSGGKFISNCLSLSKHCCPQDYNSACYLLDNPNDYDFRLKAVMSTLPSKQEDMKDWIHKFEFGDQQIYGNAVKHWHRGETTEMPMFLQKLISSDLRLFLTAHGGDELIRNLYNVWPDSPIIKLINHTSFSKISQQLKSKNEQDLDAYAGNYCKSKYNQLAGPGWPSWDVFESVGYDPRLAPSINSSIQNEMLNFYNWRDINGPIFIVNVDECYFNRDKFLSMIKMLYDWAGLNDFNPELIETFWKAYMTLHTDL